MRPPWLSWGATAAAAYALKAFYSRASAADLAWILAPTARTVGWLRGETLAFHPGAGWLAADGSYVIAPACAGVNFLILAFTVAALGFAHRLPTRRARLGWWLGAAAGAYLVTVAVNALRIVAAVALYRLGPVAGLSPAQLHRLLGILIYLGALWGLYTLLGRLLGDRRAGGLLVAGAYLGMTLLVPLLAGHPGARYAEHAMMVSLAVGLPLAGRWAALRRGRAEA